MASRLPRCSLAPQPCPAGPAHGPGGSYATVLRPPAWEVPVGLPARGCHSRGWQSRGSVRGVHRQLEPFVVNVVPSLSAKRAVPRVPWRSVHAPETKVLKLSRGTARGGTGGGGAKTRGSTAASSFSHSSRVRSHLVPGTSAFLGPRPCQIRMTFLGLLSRRLSASAFQPPPRCRWHLLPSRHCPRGPPHHKHLSLLTPGSLEESGGS